MQLQTTVHVGGGRNITANSTHRRDDGEDVIVPALFYPLGHGMAVLPHPTLVDDTLQLDLTWWVLYDAQDHVDTGIGTRHQPGSRELDSLAERYAEEVRPLPTESRRRDALERVVSELETADRAAHR